MSTEEWSITGNDTEKGSAAYEELVEADAEAPRAVPDPAAGEDAAGGAAGALDGGGAGAAGEGAEAGGEF